MPTTSHACSLPAYGATELLRSVAAWTRVDYDAGHRGRREAAASWPKQHVQGLLRKRLSY